MTLSMNVTQHNALTLYMPLSRVSQFLYYYAECRYAECRYAECRGAITTEPW